MAAQHTIHQAKTHLSKLVARAEAGEEIVLARGKTPVAKIVPLQPPPKRIRELGWLKHPISLDDGFWAPLPDDMTGEADGESG